MPPRIARSYALLFCYHFYPSSAVASRRLRAFAGILASTGLAVQIVSAFGGAPIGGGEEIATAILAQPVIEPLHLLVPWLVAMKRWFISWAGTRNKPSESPAHVPDSIADPHPPSGLQRLRDHFFAVLNTVDPHKKWAIRAARTALQSARNQDIRLVVASGPPFSGVIAAWYVARRLGVPFIVDFRDPLFAGARGVIRASVLGRIVARFFERRLMRYSASITCASPGIASALSDRYPKASGKIHLVMNGFDGEPARMSTGTDHRLSILFAGILYVNRDPFPFLTALESLLSRPDIDMKRVKVRFIGECALFGGVSLASWLDGKRTASVVELIPQRSAEELRPFMDEATVLLNFAQGQHQLIPAKTFEHLASGREVVAICEPDSDTGRLLASIRGTTRVAPDDLQALESTLVDLYERHVVQGVLRAPAPDDVLQYSRAGQNEAFLRVVRATVQGCPKTSMAAATNQRNL